ncbi:MAG: type II toxin-antitoxin system RelE/ParE family toxin [Chloroflexota bacterium]|nr:type II toxin-antitoxin system RelE/ParE family toxin [Chloroflexota bacterium]
MRIRWTTPARQDLARHHDDIAEDDPAAAERVEAAIAETVERLADYPHRGRPGQRVGTRELVIADFPTYIVVYRVTETDVRITRIWHGRQRRGRH